MPLAGWVNDASRLRAQLTRYFPQLVEADESDDLPVDVSKSAEQGLLLQRNELRPSLFDYQRELVDKLVHGGRADTQLVALPTGAGKTRTALVAALEGIGSGAFRRVVWLAPTVELLDQAFESARSLWLHQGNVDDMFLTRDLDASPPDAPSVTFATPQGVYAKARRYEDLSRWGLIVFDEAHQLGASTFRKAVRALRSSSSGVVPLVGLSATPGRTSGRETEDLVELFDRNLLVSDALRPNPVQVLQRRGVLAQLRFRAMSRKKVSADDEADRIRMAVNGCRYLTARGRRTLVFAASVAGASVLAEALRSVDVPSEVVHSGLSMAVRRRRIQDFADGNIAVLTNQRLLATGYDCPAVSDVMLLAPVGSPILFEQMVGRAARGPRTGGARVATIWEFDDHLTTHGYPKSYYRYRDFDWS